MTRYRERRWKEDVDAALRGRRVAWLVSLVEEGFINRYGHLTCDLVDPDTRERIPSDLKAKRCHVCRDLHFEHGSYCSGDCEDRAHKIGTKAKRAKGAKP